jgi:cyanophycinase
MDDTLSRIGRGRQGTIVLMVRRFLAAAVAVWLLAVASAYAQSGTLIVVGGGDTGPEIVSKALAIAGGANAIVAVLPQASAEPDAGDESVKMWKDAGANEALKVSFDDRAAATDTLKRATLIWMPGGDQNRFMKAIQGTGLDDAIRDRYAHGAAVGGTSAGAAILVRSMFTGDADLKSLTAGATVIAPGLGLWPEVLVDQHFLTRQRDNRLLSAVLDHPDLVGVGIDESTGVIVRGHAFDVIGRSSVVVMDARHAHVDKASPGQRVSGRGVSVSVLHAGQHYDLR